ncbi:heme exporter protein CcmB [Arenimonas caeni]|jgi:heme exporter protein B|uniref:Heme exporter protein B n=1 Tax=Arenimonas caeni TaxID=2058085 RepID=A0A2P6M5T6_9GAMM|nr:heme exporter protein CcmB [Arenimonas caeni]MDY0022473.1 heme exporter protein CcmB [Arenimonas caeni]PRH81346.1 heme exporter protein CcmB [Arenimonas caeni]
MSAPSLWAVARAQARRDLRLVWRRRGDAAQPLLFALMVVALFPLAVGSEPAQLARIAPGVLWVAVLLAGLLTLDTLYRGDLEDGSLEQMLLAPVPLAWLVAVRVAVHWATSALPLVLLVPLLAELLFLPGELLPLLLVSLLLGTPLLSLLGAVVAALTVGIRRSGMLLALLALPLFLPVLVFGAGSVMAAAQGLPWAGALLLLAAGLVLCLVLAPLAAAAAIRIALT